MVVKVKNVETVIVKENYNYNNAKVQVVLENLVEAINVCENQGRNFKKIQAFNEKEVEII